MTIWKNERRTRPWLRPPFSEVGEGHPATNVFVWGSALSSRDASSVLFMRLAPAHIAASARCRRVRVRVRVCVVQGREWIRWHQ